MDFVELLREHIARAPEKGYFQIGAYIAPTEARTAAAAGAAGRPARRHRARPPRWATARASCTPPASSTRVARPSAASSSSPTAILPTSTIPGRDESFGVLIDAQAMGDLAAFGAHDLPALRIDLGDDAEAGLTELLAAFGRSARLTPAITRGAGRPTRNNAAWTSSSPDSAAWAPTWRAACTQRATTWSPTTAPRHKMRDIMTEGLDGAFTPGRGGGQAAHAAHRLADGAGR